MKEKTRKIEQIKGTCRMSAEYDEKMVSLVVTSVSQNQSPVNGFGESN